jgi:glycosyltransferase involved in cell wall biosynthesis
MRISVVIPTYNSSQLVMAAVSSVLAQTHPVEEIIVVDDGSTDDTSERLASFGTTIRYIRKQNGGVSSARNCGVAVATGELIAFLDADDVWHPKKLEIQLAVLSRRPELGLIATKFYPWPGDLPDAPNDWVNHIRDISLEDLIVCNLLGTSSIIVRSDVLRAAGAFDPTLHGPEDHDMWIRVARLAPIAKLDVRLAGYGGQTPGSLSKNALRMELGERAILKKVEAAGLFRGKPILRRKAWAYFRYASGRGHYYAGNRWIAAKHLALSILVYPLPYKRLLISHSFGRIRSLAVVILKRYPGR